MNEMNVKMITLNPGEYKVEMVVLQGGDKPISGQITALAMAAHVEYIKGNALTIDHARQMAIAQVTGGDPSRFVVLYMDVTPPTSAPADHGSRVRPARCGS